MKRGAERQLTKDANDDDHDDIEEIQEPLGFQKADEPSLAKRQIRALPKRALTASRPPSLNGSSTVPTPDADSAEAVSQPKFVGFTGFGSGTAASNPFTFTPSAPSPFDSAPNSGKLTPTVLPPFSGAANPFPSGSDPAPPHPPTPAVEESDAVAFKYFKSLRGLNVSFLSAISTAVDKDPFYDVASLVDSYKKLRTTIQSEFDGPALSTTTRPSVPNSIAPHFGAWTPLEKNASLSILKPFAGPVELSSKPSISENGTKTSGFAFPYSALSSSSTPTQLPFGLISKPGDSSAHSSAAASEPAKSGFVFPPSSSSSSTSSLLSTSGFTFAAPSNTENTTLRATSGALDQGAGDPSTSASSRPASTAPSIGSSSVPNFFAATKPTSVFSTSDATSKPTPIFGTSIFGSNNVTESSKSSSPNPAPSSNKDGPKPAAFFGNATTTTSSTSASIFGSSSDKPVGFFGSASPPRASAFAFGKPSGSIGNPVGFEFGSSSPSTIDTTIPGSSSSGFSFEAPSTKPSESLFSPPMTDKSTESTPQPEAEGAEEGGEEEAAKLLPSHAHDEEGEGEEDEETTHAVRCKVYRLSKSEDKSEWKDLGVGMLRLKKHKETGVRRVLMRNSSTGRILINFRIYGSLKLSVAKTAISFIGYENNTPTSFRIRVKTEEQAADLKQAFERELVAVQATE